MRRASQAGAESAADLLPQHSGASVTWKAFMASMGSPSLPKTKFLQESGGALRRIRREGVALPCAAGL